MIETFETYEAAAERVPDTETFMVCGTRLLDGTPRYFILDRETPDEVGHDIAFEIRNGRLPSQYEKWVAEVAADLREMSDAG
jgi:hypothetical protein